MYPAKTYQYLATLHPEKTEAYAYDDGDGARKLNWPDNYGPKPTIEEVEAWTPPVSDVEFARQYAGAYQAAEYIIFLLMARVSMALIGAGLFTPENVNAEGTKFVFYHRAKIEAFKLAGRHPDAGDQLYDAIAGSVGEFPWLAENAGSILAIFGNGLPRNP